jgi:Cu(I)/Ag(I) efflux system membrane protein CusA/SilA
MDAERFAEQAANARLGKDYDTAALAPFGILRADLEGPFREKVLFRARTGGPKGDLVDDEMGRVLQVPGWSNIFTQPIINRIEMLSTGVRTDIGIKVFGPDLDTITRVCQQIEAAVKPVRGARDVVAAPIMGKGYLDVTIDRLKAAQFGVAVEEVQTEIETALGGRVVTYTVENRDRFPVRVRYARVSREDEEAVKRLLIPSGRTAGPKQGEMSATGDPMFRTTPHGGVIEHAAKGKRLIPLSAVADIRITEGPAVIKSENGRLLNYVTLMVRGRDAVGFVEEAKRVVAEKVKLPEGVHVEWAGEFEHQERAAKTLRWVFPAVILIIFLILYLTYDDLADASLMMLAVPEALAGGAFFLFLFPKLINGWDSPPLDFSVAVWVGFIACFGMATETGIIMLVYLREAIEKRGGLENIRSLDELRAAVVEGAVHRLRPKLLTEGVAIIAIFPMVFASGVGAEVLAPMALPVLGGLLISDEVVDLFLPVRFFWVRRARWQKLHDTGQLSHQRTAVVTSVPTEHDRASLASVKPTETEAISALGDVGGGILPPSSPGGIHV